jgi:hypothetical protein
MGDVHQTPSSPANQPFSAGQLFDPASPYGRMRASMKPEAKLRGFFHYLAVQAKAQDRKPAATRSRNLRVVHLVVGAAEPGQELAAELRPEMADRFGGKRQLLLSFHLEDPACWPQASTPCRAFLLTPGVLERLCGPDLARGADIVRKVLTRLFAGQSGRDPFETARILAAVPDLDGEVDATGFCKFKPVDLPEQAAALVDELPEHTAVVVVIARVS